MNRNESLGMQARIRQQAMEMQDYLRDLQSWEEKVAVRDAKLQAQKAAVTRGRKKKKKVWHDAAWNSVYVCACVCVRV